MHISKLKAQNSVARDLLTRRYTTAAAAADTPATQSAGELGTSSTVGTASVQPTITVVTPIVTMSTQAQAGVNDHEQPRTPSLGGRESGKQWFQSLFGRVIRA